MRSERTVIRCIRRLVEVGIAAYKDSPTGRRFVYRSDSGEVVAGYGIDFTPARVRMEEIRLAVDAYHRKLKEELAARRDIARLSRAIEDLCRAFPDQAEALRSQIATASDRHVNIFMRAVAVKTLYEEAVARCASVHSTAGLSGEGDISVTSNTNTTQEPTVKSNETRPRSDERHINQSSFAADSAFEKKPPPTEVPQQALAAADQQAYFGRIQADVLGSVSIGLLRAACREAQSLTGIQLENWTTLARSGETFRRMVGLSESGWLEGQQKVGIHAASAILATVLEKAIRDPQQISKPGGYFRAMVDRAVEGKLNLERSLFGLASSDYGA
jgi:replication initiation protein RepC